jgi:hypothetical protein
VGLVTSIHQKSRHNVIIVVNLVIVWLIVLWNGTKNHAMFVEMLDMRERIVYRVWNASFAKM